MILLTFLGKSNYKETNYFWRDQEYTTFYAPVAACHFLQPEKLVVFLTEEVEQTIFPELIKYLPQELEIEKKPIPLGRDERELWQIFEQVSSAVQPGDIVAFDITHGLRTFPLIGLLAAAFLRSGLNVDVQAVLYGAYDVRDQSVKPTRTPIFDLSPMLSLLEWANASDRFNRTGDARYLSSLVLQQRKPLAEQAVGNKELLEQVGLFANFVKTLEHISNNLRLIRPYQAMESIHKLQQRAEKAEPALSRSPSALPFKMLKKTIVDTFQPLGQENPQNPENITTTLQKSRQMIRWYAEHDQWVQAAALANEWLLSWIMLQLDPSQITSREKREEMANEINREANQYLEAKNKKQPFTPEVSIDSVDIKDILSLWKNLKDVRNDVLHAGMRENPAEPDTLIKNIKKIIDKLDNLPVFD